METFKLDLSKLTPVPEADRVKGNWYVVANRMDSFPIILQCGDYNNQSLASGIHWKFWFAIPPGLPGFPVVELPDEIEFDLRTWDIETPRLLTIKLSRKVKTKLPEISIPSGTKSEQVAELRKILEELENGK